MAEPRYVHYELRGRLAAAVTTYPPAGTDRRGAAVAAFREASARWLAPGMSLSTGPDDVPPDVVAPLVTFQFGPEHIPLPMEEILEWLRQHELVRLIEVERYGLTAPEQPG